MEDIYENTSVATIWNGLSDNTSVAVTTNRFVEVAQAQMKVSMVDFQNKISNKYILIVASEAVIDLPNDTSVSHLKEPHLVNEGKNYPLSTAQTIDLVWL